MAVTADVMTIVRILDEEGFGELAGDILREINAGRVPEDGGEEDGEKEGDERATSTPFAPDEQLSEVLRIIRLQLVESARHLAEAERIAAELADHRRVAIRFVDQEGLEPKDTGRDAPGEQRVADDLDALLTRIAREPPAATV